jgi:hypothetical protein
VHPPASTELRHSYTLDSLQRLAHFAARRKLWHGGLALPERAEIALSAMAEHLYASDQPPAASELIHTGWKAISEHLNQRSQFQGHDTSDRYAATTRPRFETYWRDAARHSLSPEDRIIERLALAQIWPHLRLVHQQALTALAVHGDYQQAATALGEPYATFKSQVSRARREFLELWHEGEVPSRPWVRDRRAGPGTDMHTLTYFLRLRRQRAERKHDHKASEGDQQDERQVVAV